MHVHEQPCPGKVKLTPAGLEPATSCLAGEDVTPPPPRPANLGIYMLCDNNKIVYDYCHLISFNLYKVSLKNIRCMNSIEQIFSYDISKVVCACYYEGK